MLKQCILSHLLITIIYDQNKPSLPMLNTVTLFQNTKQYIQNNGVNIYNVYDLIIIFSINKLIDSTCEPTISKACLVRSLLYLVIITYSSILDRVDKKQAVLPLLGPRQSRVRISIIADLP